MNHENPISKVLLTGAFLLLMAGVGKAGGPWTLSKKGGYFQIQATFPGYATKRLFTSSGDDLYLPRPVLDLTFQSYLEYGITDRLTMAVNVPYKYMATKDEVIEKSEYQSLLSVGSIHGLGNASLGLKYKVFEGKWLGAVSFGTEVPSLVTDSSKGLRTGYETWTFVPTLHIGGGFDNGVYTYIDAGAGIRAGGFSSEARILAELGKKFKEHFTLALSLDVRESFRNESRDYENFRHTGLFVNNQEYFAYGIKAAYEKNGFGVNFSTYGAAYGEFVAKAPFFNLGVFKKW